MQQLGDVWTLETPLEEQASASLSQVAELACGGNRKAQNYLKRLWDERWQSVKTKLETEGSVWYVWWMDGVRQHIVNYQGAA